MGELRFTLNDFNGISDTLNGQRFQWYNKQASDTDFKLKGTFIVDSIRKLRNKTEVVAYDNMIRFDTFVDDWLSGVSYPTTLAGFLSSLCSHCGVTLGTATTDITNYDYTVANTFAASNITGRVVLSYICEVAASFAHIGVDGKLYLSYYRNSPVTLDEKKYIQMQHAEYETQLIDKLQIRSTEDDIGVIVGTGSNVYVIEDNPLFYTSTSSGVQTQAEKIYNKIKNLKYMPAVVTTFEDFGIECGDIIGVSLGDAVIKKQTIESYTNTGWAINYDTNLYEDVTNTAYASVSANSSIPTQIFLKFPDMNIADTAENISINTRIKTAVSSQTAIYNFIIKMSLYDFATNSDIAGTEQPITATLSTDPTITEITASYPLRSDLPSKEIGLHITITSLIYTAHQIYIYGTDMTYTYRTSYSTLVMDKQITQSGVRFECTGNQYREEQTNRTNQLITRLQGSVHEVYVDIDGLTSRIYNAEGSMSQLTQTVNSFDVRITAAETTANSASLVAASMQAQVDSSKAQIEFLASYTTQMTNNTHIGATSPTNGMTNTDAAKIPSGTLYYPTVAHTETSPRAISFLTTWIYEWNGTQWTGFSGVATSATRPITAGFTTAFWYPPVDYTENNITYYANHLYRYDRDGAAVWLDVSSAAAQVANRTSLAKITQIANSQEASITALLQFKQDIEQSGGSISAVEVNALISAAVNNAGGTINSYLQANYYTRTQVNSQITTSQTTVTNSITQSITQSGGTINSYLAAQFADKTSVATITQTVTQHSADIALVVQNGSVRGSIIISAINNETTAVINANRISLVGKNISMTSDNITISSTYFNVDRYGNLTAASGTFTGVINANSGSIAGTLTFAGNSNFYISGTSGYRIYMYNHDTSYFNVTNGGTLQAAGAVFSTVVTVTGTMVLYNPANSSYYRGFIETLNYSLDIYTAYMPIYIDAGVSTAGAGTIYIANRGAQTIILGSTYSSFIMSINPCTIIFDKDCTINLNGATVNP